MTLYTKTVGRTHREFTHTRYVEYTYTNPHQFLPVWQIDRPDHQMPAWRGALCVTQAAAGQEGGATERDFQYGPLWLEAEAPSYELARDTVVAAVILLMRRYGIPISAMRFQFSGSRSPWVFIEPGVFGAVPSAHLHKVYQAMVHDIAQQLPVRFRRPEDSRGRQSGLTWLDESIYSWNQLRRATNSIHPKTGLWAIPLTWVELCNWSEDQVRAAARHPRSTTWIFGHSKEIPAARDWYVHHLQRNYEERRKLAVAAAKARAPRFYNGLRPCVQALLHIKGRVPSGIRNQALYAIGLGFRDAGHPQEQALEVAQGFYREHCDVVPGGDDSPMAIAATIKSAYSERRRFSQRVFNRFFSGVLERSTLPDVVRIPRDEMRCLFRRRATSAEWFEFFTDWARRESPAGCRSYVSLERAFVDISLPRLAASVGAIKTFAYLIYAAGLHRIDGGAGRWAHLVHSRVTKTTVAQTLSLATGTVGRHLAWLRAHRFLVGNAVNPVPIPLATIRLRPELLPCSSAISDFRKSEEVNRVLSQVVCGFRESVTSLRGGFIVRGTRKVQIPLRVQSKPLGRWRGGLPGCGASVSACPGGRVGLPVDPEAGWPWAGSETG